MFSIDALSETMMRRRSPVDSEKLSMFDMIYAAHHLAINRSAWGAMELDWLMDVDRKTIDEFRTISVGEHF